MRRRSRAGGSPSKSRGRRVVAPKRRAAPKAPGLRHSAAANQETKAARLARERDEALEQLSAASEILKVISSSPGDLSSVFDAILENATRICEAKFGNLFLYDGRHFHIAAMHDVAPAYVEARRRQPVVGEYPRALIRRVIETKQVLHFADITAKELRIQEDDPKLAELAKLAGARTLVVVPMLKNDELVGSINIFRQEIQPYTDRQITLLENFAAQAVIAIENTRLLNELKQRTNDLTESLEQQTATSEVLGVISSSPGELEPVFHTMLENATRICEAKFGVLYRFDGEAFHFAAEVGAPLEYSEFNLRRGAFQPQPGGQLERVMLTKQVSHTADDAVSTVPGIAAKLAGARTQIMVPMLKEGNLIGVIIIYRQEVRPFTDKQIALITNFAAQAVIAIENTRLLSELRQSLQQQTATAEVLGVISRSPGDLEPVFHAMLESATRICEAKYGNLYQFADGTFQIVASHSPSTELTSERLQGPPIRPTLGTGLGRVLKTKAAVHIHDVMSEPGYPHDDPLRHVAERGGVRTLLAVPLIQDNELVGAITIVRQEVRPFTDKQIELVQNFAAQAVIAIENTRLLNELRQSLEQQTA